VLVGGRYPQESQLLKAILNKLKPDDGSYELLDVTPKDLRSITIYSISQLKKPTVIRSEIIPAPDPSNTLSSV